MDFLSNVGNEFVRQGKAVAEGLPEEVSNNKLVKEIYLGQDF